MWGNVKSAKKFLKIRNNMKKYQKMKNLNPGKCEILWNGMKKCLRKR